jgi:hypothetical protein
MTAKVTLYTRYEIPDRRMIQRYGGMFGDEANDRAVHVDVTAEWWSDDKGPSVSVKGWCQRVKKDGSDSAHAKSDVYDAASWLTQADWKTITLRLMVDIATLTPPQDVLVAFEEALNKAEAKCTWRTP